MFSKNMYYSCLGHSGRLFPNKYFDFGPSLLILFLQVAQTVMSDLLSSPHHPAVNPNIILDNFLLDLRQSLLTRY